MHAILDAEQHLYLGYTATAADTPVYSIYSEYSLYSAFLLSGRPVREILCQNPHWWCSRVTVRDAVRTFRARRREYPYI